jgi:hypothetical protein
MARSLIDGVYALSNDILNLPIFQLKQFADPA